MSKIYQISGALSQERQNFLLVTEGSRSYILHELSIAIHSNQFNKQFIMQSYKQIHSTEGRQQNYFHGTELTQSKHRTK